MKPTRADFTKASSHPSGNGFTHAQIKILGADPKKPWIADFIGREIPDATWEAFVRAGDKLRAKNQNQNIQHLF